MLCPSFLGHYKKEKLSDFLLAFLWGALRLLEHEKNSVIYKYLIDVINIQYYNQRYIDLMSGGNI